MRWLVSKENVQRPIKKSYKSPHKSKRPVILSEREGSPTISSCCAGNDQRFFAALRMTVLFMRWLVELERVENVTRDQQQIFSQRP